MRFNKWHDVQEIAVQEKSYVEVLQLQVKFVATL
jgi:hypothetical protein